jgi:murein DD-endopeptidase MepM/ murein hydrolase activator NlpD
MKICRLFEKDWFTISFPKNSKPCFKGGGKPMKRTTIQRLKGIVRKFFTPITIMFIPHTKARAINLRIPSIGIAACVVLWIIGTAYVVTSAVRIIEYQAMKEKIASYSKELIELSSSIAVIKKTEKEFKHLVSLGSKEKILENLDEEPIESIDMEHIGQEIEKTIASVAEINEFLQTQKDIYKTTPRAMPADGSISSHFGMREDPRSAEDRFHAGVDIRASSGSPIRATADGIVSFSGWNGKNGNLIAIEHGSGFRTLYAHNRVNIVKIGQRVKRGDVVGYVGTTGNATGSHVHYEVWKDGKPVDPGKFIKGRS